MTHAIDLDLRDGSDPTTESSGDSGSLPDPASGEEQDLHRVYPGSPGGANPDEQIRRHVTELLATIHAAVAAGLPVGRTPEPAPQKVPSLDDHYRAMGIPAPARMRTKRAAPPLQPVATALCALINRGSFHGDDLAIRCGDRETAHRALLAAERVGWIVRGKFDLSIQQRALPSKHHLPGCNWVRDVHGDRWTDPPIGHYWITETTTYLTDEMVSATLSCGGV